MLRKPAFLWTCLLLVSCDNPGPPDVRNDAESPKGEVVGRGHASRQQSLRTQANLRIDFKNAVNIAPVADREKALADLAWNALEIDPNLASKAFQQLPIGNTEKTRLIQHHAMRLAERNPDEAIAWADALGSEQEIAAAKAQIALVLAEADPHRSANLLSESGIAGREFDVAVVQVVQRWAAQSPPVAVAWVTLFPPGAAREAGIKIISEQWLPRDAPAAFDWLETLQDEVFRKESLRAMEGVILQQPKTIRDAWLKHANAGILADLDQQREQAIKDVGDNIPSPEK